MTFDGRAMASTVSTRSTRRRLLLALILILLSTAGGGLVGTLAAPSPPTAVARLDTQLADARANTDALATRVRELTTAVLSGTATPESLNEARAQLTTSMHIERAIQDQVDELTESNPHPPLLAAGIGALVGLIIASAAVAMGVQRRTKSFRNRATVLGSNANDSTN